MTEPIHSGPHLEDANHLPPTAAQTSLERPWPLRHLSKKLYDYIDRAPAAWVEGEVIALHRRAKISYLTLRDLGDPEHRTDKDEDEKASLNVAVPHGIVDAMPTPLEPGARVVTLLKPGFWVRTGRLSFLAHRIQLVGVGELLARIEMLRQRLASEGLFSLERKRPLPLLPQVIGLITGKNSDAMKDVIGNARLRWPAAQFAVREVAVQGADCVPQVTGALRELDEHPDVDIIVVARGGGSLEDLLGFSNETLLRTAAQLSTPLVSAIGHEADRPLLDEVADLRASTPTDAAARIVPDLEQERAGIQRSHVALFRAVRHLIGRERDQLELLKNRRVLTDPEYFMSGHREAIAQLRQRCESALNSLVSRQSDQLRHLQGTVRALSPQKTLERGYAIVQDSRGELITRPEEGAAGTLLHIRVASGALWALSQGPEVEAFTPSP